MQLGIYKHSSGYRSLMAYVLYQALMELNHKDKRLRDDAKEFLLSDDGELYCYILDIDYDVVTSIDFDNPSNSLNFNIGIGRNKL